VTNFLNKARFNAISRHWMRKLGLSIYDGLNFHPFRNEIVTDFYFDFGCSGMCLLIRDEEFCWNCTVGQGAFTGTSKTSWMQVGLEQGEVYSTE
jgi:hypothetical protein